MSRPITELSRLSIQQRAMLELRLKRKREHLSRAPIERRQRGEASFPLSSAQRRLWFLHQWNPFNPAYNIVAALRLSGRLDVKALERAVSELVNRHEVLRTTFRLIEEEPAQVIGAAAPVSLDLLDLSQLPRSDVEARLAEESSREGRRPFDLAYGPLFRARLLKLTDEEFALLLSMHHIVGDGWSTGVILRELTSLYRAFSESRPSPLQKPPLQFADYAVWEQAWLQSAESSDQVAYWRKQLADAPQALELPTKGARPLLQSFSGARHSFALPERLSAGLKHLSEREGVTLFMTLLAAFKTLLYRYTGQNDIIVGTPVSGRLRQELEGVVGVFINMLALRSGLSGEQTFEAVLRQVRETTLQALAHQSIPFDRLIEDLQPARELSHSPLVQVTFSLQVAAAQQEFAGLRVQPQAVEITTTKYDLSLSITSSAGPLRGTITYNTDLFDADAIRRMAEHFGVLLEDILANPRKKVSELRLLGDDERRKMLRDLNQTRRAYPADCLPQVFERQAARTPNSPALICAAREVTYEELNRRANRLAHYLRGLGAGPETLVAICVDRSVEMVVGLLAILKSGAAYVPIDPAFPQSRLAFMLEDARAEVLLTQESLRPTLPPCSARLVCIDTDWEEIDRWPGNNLAPAARQDNLAYMIYTSGSTGVPKGVQVPHGALSNFLHSMAERPGLGPEERLLAVTTLSFDIAALELFLPLTVGAAVELLPREIATDGGRLQERLQASSAPVMQATPATWRLLLEAGWEGHPRLRVLCGGEALPRDLADALLSRAACVWNMYGPTETTIWSTCCAVTGGGVVSIGRPIANTEVYVLDSHFNPTPAGIIGELYIGGAGVARGYKGRPELTADRFIPDAFGVGAGGRLYRTGDLARYLPDGSIALVGRTDEQVKLRGYRIELGEIEATLRTMAGVEQAVVMVGEDAAGDRRLVAYVVAEAGGGPAVTDMRRHVQQQLPDYMVPAAFVLLDEMPLTPNGKVNRRALPPPEQTRGEAGQGFRAPRNRVELELSQIWEELLGVRPVGIGDNFFELGGHSLLAKRMMIRVAKRFGQELPLATFFQEPTVEAMAARLGEVSAAATASPLVAVQPRGSLTPFFCVHSIGGDVMRFSALAQAMGDEQPFYAFQAAHPSELGEATASIEEMAADYIRAMREVQPGGPYLLGGYSFGSIVAFEMAQQLTRRGERVALLALLDGSSPLVQQAAEERSDAVVLAGFARDLARVSGVEIDLPHWKVQRMENEEGMSHILAILKRNDLVSADAEVDYFRRFVRGLRVRNAAVRQYAPSVYRGPMTIFRSTQIEAESAAAWKQAGVNVADPARGWDRLSEQPLEIHKIPGHHATMISKPHVEVLAAKLRACIERASATLSAS